MTPAKMEVYEKKSSKIITRYLNGGHLQRAEFPNQDYFYSLYLWCETVVYTRYLCFLSCDSAAVLLKMEKILAASRKKGYRKT
jgi:hypothetical protein